MTTRILRAASLLVLLAAASPAWAEEYRVHVNGLSCPFCAYGIEKKLGQIKGVEKVETDIAAGSVTVTTDEGALLDRGDELYVPEYFNDRIQVFGLDGTPKRIIGRPGSGPGEFHAPGGVAVAANGDLFVADFYNHRIQKFLPDGTFLASFGSKGSGPARFDHPVAVAAAGDGTVLAVDFANNRVQKWRPAE